MNGKGSNITCEYCGNGSHAPSIETSDYEIWEGLPPGWLRRQKVFCGELEGESTVCSEECAHGLVAREKAEVDARHAAYQQQIKAAPK